MTPSRSPDRSRARVEGLEHLRDLGGCSRQGGGQTPGGVFFRSETVDRVRPSGWGALFDLGIRTVVDLRRPVEIASDATARPGWLTTTEVDLDGFEDQAFWEEHVATGRFGTALYYRPHLAAMPERATRALTAIVNAPPGGVLFHCMGGRDRTGLVSMLLLIAARATPDAIVGDYMTTVRAVAGSSASGSAREVTLDEICVRHGTTVEGAFRQAMDGLDLGGLLHAGGMDGDTRAALYSWRGTLDPR